MALDIDAVLDRRQLRRKLTFWRIAAFVVLALALVALLAASGVLGKLDTAGNHIARINVAGVINEDKALLGMIERIRKDDKVKGVVLVVDSPGGTAVGGEAIHAELRELAKAKPMVASVGTLAASAGYMVAAAADHIVARRSSIVGSIGVIFQYPQAHELLDKLGIEVREIKSSPLKAEPSPFHVPPPGAEAVLQRVIDDTYAHFIDMVADRRPLTRAEVVPLADGSVYSGTASVKNRLIDAIGGEDEARKWLIDEKGLDKDLELITWAPPRPRSGLLFANLAGWLGLPEATVAAVLPNGMAEGLRLEGLLAYWRGNVR